MCGDLTLDLSLYEQTCFNVNISCPEYFLPHVFHSPSANWFSLPCASAHTDLEEGLTAARRCERRR